MIVESLEEYYLRHGEYPSPESIVGSAASAKTTLRISNDNVLTAPLAPAGTTNSLTDQDIETDGESNTMEDLYAYVANCEEENACNSFLFKYREESTGDIITVESRRKPGLAPVTTDPDTVPAPDAPTANAGVYGSAVVGTVETAVTCETGDAQYRLRSRINEDAWSNWSTYGTQSGTTLSLPLAASTTYGFQAVARCISGVTVSDDSPVSPIAEYYHPGPASTPSMSAALSGSNVVGTSSTVSCEPGFSAEYQLRSRENDGTWSSWSSWSATRTTPLPASAGKKYSFQAHARCGSTGTISPDSNIANYIHPISPPSTPSMTAGMYGTYVRGTISAVSCPSGTSPQYRIAYRYNSNSLSWGGWSTSRVRDITAYYGARHTFQGQARCISAFTQGSPATTSTVNYVRGFIHVTESGGTMACGGGSCYWTQNWKFSHPGPTSGASYDYGTWQCRKKRVSNGTWTGWSSNMSSSPSDSDSVCGYIKCPNYSYVQFRYTFVRMTSAYDTGPSITPMTNQAKCNY